MQKASVLPSCISLSRVEIVFITRTTVDYPDTPAAPIGPSRAPALSFDAKPRARRTDRVPSSTSAFTLASCSPGGRAGRRGSGSPRPFSGEGTRPGSR